MYISDPVAPSRAHVVPTEQDSDPHRGRTWTDGAETDESPPHTGGGRRPRPLHDSRPGVGPQNLLPAAGRDLLKDASVDFSNV